MDCSLLVPPRPGPDGRSRYAMLETLRAYGAGLLAEAGEQDRAAAALAGYALRVAEQAAAGLQTTAGEVAAARWLDAEDATMRQVLAWAMEHDAAMALRLAAALGWWWFLRGRLAGQYPLLREAAGRAEPGSDGWCAAQFWLGLDGGVRARSGRGAGPFHRGPGRRRGPGAVPGAGGLPGRPVGGVAEYGPARRGGRRCAAAPWPWPGRLGYPAGEVLALASLAIAALTPAIYDDAVQLARQAGQITAGMPGWMARVSQLSLTAALIAAGDLAAAERACAAALARCPGRGRPARP